MWAQAHSMPGLSRWAPHLSVVLVTIFFAQAAVINPQGKGNGTNGLSDEPEVGYPGVNSVAPGPLAQCNNYYADIVFVVDSTAAYMNDDYWKKVKEFLAEVSVVLGAGLDDRIRLGMVVYGQNYSQVFSLNNFTESSQIAQAIRNAERHRNDTTADLTQILNGLHAELFTYENGARMFLPHQAVIFTTPLQQNETAEEEIIKEVAMVHDAGIETYSIAIETEVDFEDLAKLLASPPRRPGENYWYLRQFGDMDMSLATDLAAELCTYNRDTSITFSRSYAPTNERDQYNNQQDFDDNQFRARAPNDENYDQRQKNNFGGPPVIRNDNYDDRRDDRDDRDDGRRFEQPREERRPPPPPPRNREPPRQSRPRGHRPRGPGPRIGSSYQGPPPRKDGGGNGPPPPGGKGPGGGKPEGQNIRVAGIGASGGRAPQANSGYVPSGGYAFGGHDGFRGPNRSPQGVPLRGLNGHGYGGHDGFVGYGPHAFSYGSAGVRGPVFGPRAPVFRATKTRNPPPPRPKEVDERRERGPRREDSREKFDNDRRDQESFRPPPRDEEHFRPPPPRDDRDNFRSGPPRENFRPPPQQNKFRPPPPPPRDNFHGSQRPPPPQNERGNFRNDFNDDSQHQGNRPPPQNFNRPPPQQDFHDDRPPPNQFQNNRPPPPPPRGRFQDNGPRRPPPNNFRHDNSRARDESPQQDERLSNHQENFEPPPSRLV